MPSRPRCAPTRRVASAKNNATLTFVHAARAQTLIWHPDKNPGDVQAERVYQRMEKAYNTLMDVEQRKAHDAALLARANGTSTRLVARADRDAPATCTAADSSSGSGSLSATELEKRQLPPEDLGAPPPTARPFAYIDKEPGSVTPAARAGLRRGDALLRIGEASHLRDVQAQLHASLHQPLPVLVIDMQGRFLKRWVVPHAWDYAAPASLLGCQMSDQCPTDLVATHPVEMADRQRHRNKHAAAASRDKEEEEEEEEDEDDDDEDARHGKRRGAPSAAPSHARPTSRMPRGPPSGAESAGPCWARALLLLTSLAGISLGGTIVIAPAVSYEIFDVWSLINLQCDDIIEYITVAAVPPYAPPPPAPPGGYSPPPPQGFVAGGIHSSVQRRKMGAGGVGGVPTGVRARTVARRLVNSNESAVGDGQNADVVQNSALPPQMALAPPPRAPKPSPPPTLPQAYYNAAPFSPPSSPPVHPSPPPPEAAARASASAASHTHTGVGGSVMGNVQQSIDTQGTYHADDHPMGTFVQTIVATNVGIDVIRNPVLYLLTAALTMIVISCFGVALACIPPSRARGLLTAVYLCLGLPAWIFLVFVAVSSLALRDDAAALVEQYWQCLKHVSPSHDGASTIPDAFQHLGTAASIVIAACAMLLAALLAACSAIGWRTLSRHSIVCISMVSGLVGAVTLALGVVLKTTSNMEHQFFDGAVMGVGGSVFVVSLIGIVGSKQESRCLLRTYAGALAALIVAIAGVSGYLLVEGDAAVTSWLEANWQAISAHVCTSAVNLCAGTLITRGELRQRANAHLLEITTLLVLLLLVLVVDLLMACVLQYLVAKHGRGSRQAEIEIKRLVRDDDDDDDEV